MSSTSPVTVVVVPRQRFSMARRSLLSVLKHTPPSTPLVYVDGGSPRPLREWLDRCARRRGFSIIRTPHYLSPNEARNLGMRAVETPYVVFVDNDVLVAPGWVDALVRCADETGAWVVGPLYCIGEPPFTTVHMAGGDLELIARPDGHWLRDTHRLSYEPLERVRASLRREPCGFAEFHAALVRREVFDKVGPLDEELLSTPEHLDLSLLVARAGGTVWFEPTAMVNYLPARRIRPAEARFYLLRWSDRWNRASLARFRAKWALAPDDPFSAGHYMWITDKRMLVFEPVWSALRKGMGWRGSLWAARAFERGLTRFLIPDEEGRRRAHEAFRVPPTGLAPAA